MKSYVYISKVIIFLLILILPVSVACLSFAQTGKNTTGSGELKGKVDPKRFISIDFNSVDINVFIKFISELTGKNFVVDNKVKGKVTVISPSKISVKEAYKVFESVLEVHGYATVAAGKVIKIIPSPQARTKNIKTLLKESAASPEDKIITQIITLKYANASEIKKLFTPLVSKSSVVLAYSPTNMLIVTDFHSNIIRLIRILKAIDVAGIGHEISVIPLEFADAEKLVKILSSVFQPKKAARKGASERTITLIADDRTNTVVLLASEVDSLRVRSLISMLDKPTPKDKGKIRVYYLEHATAEELATVLQAQTSGKSKTAAKGGKAPLLSGQATITADKATNSLIIMADNEDYQILEGIIKKLDIPRAMVFIECLIMEVNTNKDFKLGTEWRGFGEAHHDDKDGAAGGGFSGDEATSLAGLAATGALPSGFSLGVFGEAINISGIDFPTIAAIIEVYKKDKDVQIISTPQLLTTDNEEAKIYVGKNIPFQTRSTAEGGTETYSSYEYRDVGTSLKITPQISQDGMVRLAISQEVARLESTTDFRPTTLKRTIDTTVIVDDNSTVVIGGLIDDSFSKTEYKVPILGDIPLLGWLFKSRKKGREKTNLFVFLTPHVINNRADAQKLYNQKKEKISEVEKGSIKMYKTNTKKSTSTSREPDGR
ncbi:MAG: type II secretion system secretin GspD [Thermodesulfobacteriota bacterium]|nr:type II secretion system secretin GspD [Thermodesulfobacteriota bacterium]